MGSTEEICNLIIFVNGFWIKGWTGKLVRSQYPYQNYWRLPHEVNLQDQCPETIEQEVKGAFVNAAKKFFKAQDTIFIDCEMPMLNKASSRFRKGALKMNKLLLKEKPLSSYNKIYFVSHSAGCAYANGMIDTALKHHLKVEEHLMIAPFQVEKIITHPAVKTTQVNVEGDFLSKSSGQNIIAKNVHKSVWIEDSQTQNWRKIYPKVDNSNHGIVRMHPYLFEEI